jgi:hypothetical protein
MSRYSKPVYLDLPKLHSGEFKWDAPPIRLTPTQSADHSVTVENVPRQELTNGRSMKQKAQ